MAQNSRLYSEVVKEVFDDELIPTDTSLEQIATEKLILDKFSISDTVYNYDLDAPRLNKAKHLCYLTKALSGLGSSYQCLDSSRPWLCYWIVHSLQLLGHKFTEESVSNVADFINRCQCEDGGFGGGPGQFGHMATTYAAVCALCTLDSPIAFNVINREQLLRFLWRIKQPNGCFAVQEGGEEDIRGVYCAVVVAYLANIHSEDLFENSAEWISSCQTYEGGFAGYPGAEAHGGYTFCGLAALVLLNKTTLCDLKSLLRWSANRQMKLEGGFQGRSNKLVDGCYSFWVGGVFPILHSLLAKDDSRLVEDSRWLFHQEALQEYILMACQYPQGGLLDKPSKKSDLYHTCYVLSGLSVSQHSKQGVVVGSEHNLLDTVHPLFNICQDPANNALQFFRNLPKPIYLK